MQEIERVIKQQGVLSVSNSYDWDKDYTPPELWFDDFFEQLNPSIWRMENELDGFLILRGCTIENCLLRLTISKYSGN